MDYARIAPDVKLGKDVVIHAFVNLYGCSIGDETKVGTFVEIQKGAAVGKRCKISSHTFICTGVTIEDEVFVGHNVSFINDKYPRATNPDGDAIVVPKPTSLPPNADAAPDTTGASAAKR